MKAIISDIHANFEALCSVHQDILQLGIDEIICLGDIVGYGPDPEKCVDFILTHASISLMGNHDYALIHEAAGFNPIAAEIIQLTRQKMEPNSRDRFSEVRKTFEPDYFPCTHHEDNPSCLIMKHTKPSRWEYLKHLSPSYKNTEETILYVHASPLDPLFEYVLPDTFPGIWNLERIDELFGSFQQLCFCGHTHHPCVIGSDYRCIFPQSPEAESGLVLNPEQKFIINPGSVGQPRDGDPRACYLLFDEETHRIIWRRVPYDIETVVHKITAMCGVESYCGARLRKGR